MKTLSQLDEALRRSDRSYGLNILRVASAVKDGETVTFGTNVFEVDFSSTPNITAGRIRVDLSASPTLAAASLVGTFAANAVADETVTIAGQVYTWKASPTVANEVLVGADLTASRNNLVAAIMAAAGAGTTYGTGTVANASVTAVATSTNAVTITAKNKGVVGNAITVAEAMSQFSWAGAATTLSGGVDATAAEFTTAMAALNVANVKIERPDANFLLFTDYSARGDVQALACSETLSGSNNAWGNATTYGFQGEPQAPKKRATVKRVPLAVEVTHGSMYFVFPFTPTRVKVSVFVTSNGTPKAWAGPVGISGGRVKIDNATVNDFATTDTVIVEAME